MKLWLMKSEPEVYSIDDLARDSSTTWEGVRNFQARNYLRNDARTGDLVLFYHSNADPSGVAGLARVSREAYPDPTQFQKKSPYYDETSSPDDPRWSMVDVEFVEKFDQVLPLETLKNDPKLGKMLVVQKGQRLSVQPVERTHFAHVLSLAGAKTALPAAGRASRSR
jgi:predicted RNA-binding protein with PUA-like domain